MGLAMNKIFENKSQFFEHLKSQGIFWCYDKNISLEQVHDDIIIEHTLKYADFFEIADLFKFYDKDKILRVWSDTMKDDERFEKINVLIARVFLDLDFEKGDYDSKPLRRRKIEMLASKD